MIWTILILIVAIALFLGGGKMLKLGDKGKAATWKIICKKSIKLVSIILLVIGVNRLGLGTSHYLTQSNPMILQDMANGMQAQKNAEISRGIRSYVRDNMESMMKDAPVMGNVDAKKTIFLFSAHSCGYCGRVHGELERVIADRDDVRVVMKNFSIHGPMSDFPAKATIAAKMQDNGKAVALDHALFTETYIPENSRDMDAGKLEAAVKKNVLKLAEKVGLDVKQLEQDVDSATVARELNQVRELASRFQIGGTPFLIIQDQAFPGAISYGQIMEALK